MIQSYRSEDFPSIPALAALKRRVGETVSVVIPAQNEASTVGSIVNTVRERLVATGLVDEVVVMNDGSVDATAEVAHAAGADVISVQDITPHVDAHGKGVALWKSQFVTNGTIIVFIDSDLLDFEERFVAGLAGALLHDRKLELVKASYRRPLVASSAIIDDGGGRVTELMVRPLLSCFLPQLSDLHQPLGGEYAVRRSTVEAMHFYSGYGVEIGLLLEYYFTCGIASIGQVDVGKRTHRNRPLAELSPMSFEIVQVLFDYLDEQDYCTIRHPRNAILKLMEEGTWKTSRYDDVRLPSKRFTEGELASHGT
jgi:glucosyl-3-phosphoglycerate synthase